MDIKNFVRVGDDLLNPTLIKRIDLQATDQTGQNCVAVYWSGEDTPHFLYNADAESTRTNAPTVTIADLGQMRTSHAGGGGGGGLPMGTGPGGLR